MKKYKGELALLFVSFIWGTGYVMTAVALSQFDTFQIIACRFLLSVLILGIIFHKKLSTLDMPSIKYGIVLGLLLVFGYMLMITGLHYTTPAKNAFIIATSVVIVPFIGKLLYRRKIDTYNIIGAFTALLGVVVISFAFDGLFNIGDAFTFAGTVLFSFHLFYTSEFMSRGVDVPGVVTVQIGVCGVIALIAALIAGQTDFSRVQADGVVMLLFMTIFTTSLCFLIQTWAQKFTSETKTAVILSMECVFGALLSVVLGFENPTVRMFIGAVLIFAGVLVTVIRPFKTINNNLTPPATDNCQ